MHGLTNLMDEAMQKGDQLRLPTLIQYGKNDQIVPKEPVLQILKKMSANSRTAIYEHGYHMLLRDLRGEQPLTDIAIWIADHNAPLTYGRSSWQ
jgi:alpha-beta hydrolase superfamily lysophospholipase